MIADEPGGWRFDLPGMARCNGLPNVVCDVSGGPHNGTLYVIWSDQRNGIDNTDVFIIVSADRGEHWSAPRRVSTDSSNRHQYMPTAVVDPTNGTLVIVYYDRRATVDDATDVTLARSMDGGLHFMETRVSDSSFTPLQYIFMGDYIGVDAYGGIAHPVWTRQDKGALTIHTAFVRTGGTSLIVEHAGDIPVVPVLAQNFPNLFGGGIAGTTTSIGFRIPPRNIAASPVRLDVIDAGGRTVRTLLKDAMPPGVYSVSFDAKDLPSGMYHYRLQSSGQFAERTMTIVR